MQKGSQPKAIHLFHVVEDVPGGVRLALLVVADPHIQRGTVHHCKAPTRSVDGVGPAC